MKSIKKKIQKRLVQTNIYQKPLIVLKNLPENKILSNRVCKGTIVEKWLVKKTYKYPLYVEIVAKARSIGAYTEGKKIPEGKTILVKAKNYILTEAQTTNALQLSPESVLQKMNKYIKLLPLSIMCQFVLTPYHI